MNPSNPSIRAFSFRLPVLDMCKEATESNESLLQFIYCYVSESCQDPNSYSMVRSCSIVLLKRTGGIQLRRQKNPQAIGHWFQPLPCRYYVIHARFPP